jgi:hypothetical protein
MMRSSSRNLLEQDLRADHLHAAPVDRAAGETAQEQHPQRAKIGRVESVFVAGGGGDGHH